MIVTQHGIGDKCYWSDHYATWRRDVTEFTPCTEVQKTCRTWPRYQTFAVHGKPICLVNIEMISPRTPYIRIFVEIKILHNLFLNMENFELQISVELAWNSQNESYASWHTLNAVFIMSNVHSRIAPSGDALLSCNK